MSKLSCIIPAAGIGKRMKSYGPKALIELNDGITVIQRQINIIQKLHQKAEIIVVVGFEADRLRKALPAGIRTIENDDYQETNVAYSLSLGVQVAKHNNLLIVYGDLVFNQATLAALACTESTVIIDKQKRFNKGEVGVTVVEGFTTRFSYGLPIKWGQIVYLTRHEADIFKRIIVQKNKRKLFGFEILNQLLDYGGSLKWTQPDTMEIAEIDTSKDIEAARRIK